MKADLIPADIPIPPVPAKERWSKYLFWAALAALLAWSFSSAEMYRAPSLVTDAGNMGRYASGFLTPSFKEWRYYLSELVVTVQIAIWGTFLAVVFGMPLSLLCSNNVAPPWIVQPVRRLMDACRSINELVWAVFFVVAVGLGPFAGVMAIFINTMGVVAKLFSEAVEASDPRPVEGIRATGATKTQEVLYGIVPQVMPLWLSYSLYRFESNVRGATVLGIVGAGGIGQVLFESIRGFYYAETAALMIMVIATVALVDIISQQLRKVMI
jgi:phosphonate transport system permease protein